MMKNIFLVFISLLLSFHIQAQNNTYARKIIDTLCSKEMYGRGYINKGDQKAANFIESEFSKIGLKPLSGNFQQKFIFNINTFPNQPKIILNNKNLILGVDYIISANSGKGKGESKLIDYKKFVKKNDISKYGLFLTNNEYQKITKEKALFEKAITSKIIVKKNSKKLTASLSQYNLQLPIIEIIDSSHSKMKKIVFDVNSELLKNYKSQNVFGMIEGSSIKDSFLFYSAHYDHLGGMGEIYFPGANDNAAGIAMLFDLAKYYIENPPKMNVIFIAFGGEEAGLIGSKYFVDNSPIDLSKIKFLMNLDLVGTGEEGITVVNGKVFENDFNRLTKINNQKNYLSIIKARGKAANSDHYFFSEKDIPSFFIYGMGKPGHYHDINDNGSDLKLEKYNEIKSLVIDFMK